MFHLVSLSLQISLNVLPGPCLGLCVGVVCFVGFVGLVGFLSLGKFDLNHRLIPVVDRPCLALVRQCREKKKLYSLSAPSLFYSDLSVLLLLSPASSSPLKVFAQSGSAQRGNTLRSHDPKWSLAAMSGAFRVGAAYDLQLSSCAFPMCRLRSRCQLCRWMLRTTCYTFVSWHSPHHFSSSL